MQGRVVVFAGGSSNTYSHGACILRARIRTSSLLAPGNRQLVLGMGPCSWEPWLTRPWSTTGPGARIVLFGGLTAGGEIGDTWLLYGGLLASGGLTARSRICALFPPPRPNRNRRVPLATTRIEWINPHAPGGR
jgi:hypothetical protein